MKPTQVFEPAKPLPQPAITPTLISRYRLMWVGVWVALGYPRVTCDNH